MIAGNKKASSEAFFIGWWKLCAHYSNLQMLPWLENVQARDNLKVIQVPVIFNEYLSDDGIAAETELLEVLRVNTGIE